MAVLYSAGELMNGSDMNDVERADRFSDGTFIHTSAIVQVEREGPFWVLHTLSGSFYVMISFNILKGAQSLDDYLHRLLTMAHPEPWQLH